MFNGQRKKEGGQSSCAVISIFFYLQFPKLLSFNSEKENDEADSIDTPSTIRKASSVTNLAEMASNKRKSSVKRFTTLKN